jgi:hypothetical protein
MKETTLDIKSQIDPYTTIVCGFNISLSSIDKLSRQKNHLRNFFIGKLQNRTNELNRHLIIIHPTAAEYMYFSANHGTCSKVDHI